VGVLDLDQRGRRVDAVVARLDCRGEGSALKMPPLPISVSWTPAFAAEPPVSCQTAWLSRLTMTSSPGRVRTRSAT
jgi:hypothetical protein